MFLPAPLWYTIRRSQVAHIFLQFRAAILIIHAFWFGFIIISRPFAFMLMFMVHPILRGRQSLWSFEFSAYLSLTKRRSALSTFPVLLLLFFILSLCTCVWFSARLVASVCLLLGRLFDHFSFYLHVTFFIYLSSAWARSLESTPALYLQNFPL